MATPYWSIGAVGIFVDEHNIRDEAVYGEQHVLDAETTTKHYSGAMGWKGHIAGTLYTSGSSGPELTTLRGYLRSSTSRTLTTDNGTFGSFKVLNIDADRQQALGDEYPVYRVRIELAEAT